MGSKRQICIGGIPVGGGAPVTVQSMTTTNTSDTAATVAQIKRLIASGCDIVRVAVPDMPSACAIEEIKRGLGYEIPLVADIHFDYRLALRALESGADKIRINPGNIGGEERVRAVANACRARGAPIRIGVNGGSIEKDILAKHGGVTPEALVESALGHIALLNKFDFYDICVSVKASNVALTVAAYRLLAERIEYPIHIGVTETGTEYIGLIKSSIGIGSLLLDGIGDTLRVSLTAEPEHEADAGIAILRSLGLRNGAELISCPTCGRCRLDLISAAHEVERRLKYVRRNIIVAVMGCSVNGPGEASRADYGIAGGDRAGVLFRKGEIIKKVAADRLVDELFAAIESEESEA